MLNRIVLMGRLTRDPELRHTQAGTAVASFSIAVDRDFKDRTTGEKVTDFIDIVAWRQTAEFVSRYFAKGRMAVVEGRLQLRDWTDKEGNKRRSAEVVAENIYFGDSKRDTDNGYAAPYTPPASAGTPYSAPAASAGGYNTAPAGGYAAPAAPAGAYSAPAAGYTAPAAPAAPGYTPPAGSDPFADFSDDDGELPF